MCLPLKTLKWRLKVSVATSSLLATRTNAKSSHRLPFTLEAIVKWESPKGSPRAMTRHTDGHGWFFKELGKRRFFSKNRIES
jgi:hypothetical protein